MDWTRREVYPFSAIVGQDKMKLALILNAIQPSIGGVLIRGEKGTAKSTAVRALASVLPDIDVVSGCSFSCSPSHYEKMCPDCRARVKHEQTLPVYRRKIRMIDLPLGATEDRIIGSMDIEYAIKEGERRFTPGLLAEANRGILYIDEVNLLNDHLVDIILDAASMGVNIVEREGISYFHPAEFILVGTMNPEEGELRPQLIDRFGICIEVQGIREPPKRVEVSKLRERFDQDAYKFILSYQKEQDELIRRIIHARKLYPRIKICEEMIRLCSKLAMEAYAAGHRADIIMRKTAIAIASLEERDEVTEKDINLAAELVLFHRYRLSSPPPKEDHSQNEESSQDQHEQDKKNDQELQGEEQKQEHYRENKKMEESGEGDTENNDHKSKSSGVSILDTVFPIGDTFNVKRIQTERDRTLRKGSGRRSRTKTSSKAGRYITSTMQRKSNDLALDATIRAAAPFQIRRQRNDVTIAIENDDIREKVREKRIGNFIVLVVDASGSMGAGKRMIETKGAILSLLMDAYQKRDKISLVAFKGDRAEMILPPTNSIELTYKLLEELPTGGKTPLTHGLDIGYQVVQSYFHKDPNISPMLVLISDGKANVSMYGKKPIDETIEIADAIKDDTRLKTIVVDVEKSGIVTFELAKRIADRMGARYFRIEDLKADTLVEVIKSESFT